MYAAFSTYMIQTMKPFIVREMTFKGHWQWYSSLGHISVSISSLH